MNLPNRLTLARCVMAMIFVVLMSFEYVVSYLLAYLVFIAAAVTDALDGRIARARNLETNFGRLLDPVADKVLMLAAFLMMMKIDDLWIPGWAIVAILAREFLVTGGRLLAAAEGKVISADVSGKTKTVLQMIYVFVFLFFALFFLVVRDYPWLEAYLPNKLEQIKFALGLASRTAISFIAAFTLYSGIVFLRKNWNALGLDSAS